MKTKAMAVALAAALAATVFADKVTLKSGSFLTGKTGSISADTVEFASDDLGDIKIKVANIASLESEKTHKIVFKDNTTAEKAVVVVDGALAADGKKLDMDGVKAIDPAEETWHASVNLSASIARGNTVSESATILADASRRWEVNRFTSSLGYYFAQSGDSKETKQKTASRFEITGQDDLFLNAISDALSSKSYTYVNGKYEFDQIMDLDRRLRLGWGLGYQWLEGTDFGAGKMSFNQELGFSWVNEKYERLDADDYATLRYAHHFAWDVARVENLAFTHNFEYLPDLDEMGDNFIIDADAGLSYMFLPNWQIMAKIEWDYARRTAPGVKHSDLRYTLGVGYKW
jgi:putative salt-induced outer membrane protein YdiY